MIHGLCLTCAYFEHVDDGAEIDEGMCRYNPPTASYSAELDLCCSAWPHVNAMDWCGKHRPSEQIDK